MVPLVQTDPLWFVVQVDPHQADAVDHVRTIIGRARPALAPYLGAIVFDPSTFHAPYAAPTVADLDQLDRQTHPDVFAVVATATSITLWPAAATLDPIRQNRSAWTLVCGQITLERHHNDPLVQAMGTVLDAMGTLAVPDAPFPLRALYVTPDDGPLLRCALREIVVRKRPSTEVDPGTDMVWFGGAPTRLSNGVESVGPLLWAQLARNLPRTAATRPLRHAMLPHLAAIVEHAPAHPLVPALLALIIETRVPTAAQVRLIDQWLLRVARDRRIAYDASTATPRAAVVIWGWVISNPVPRPPALLAKVYAALSALLRFSADDGALRAHTLALWALHPRHDRDQQQTLFDRARCALASGVDPSHRPALHALLDTETRWATFGLGPQPRWERPVVLARTSRVPLRPSTQALHGLAMVGHLVVQHPAQVAAWLATLTDAIEGHSRWTPAERNDLCWRIEAHHAALALAAQSADAQTAYAVLHAAAQRYRQGRRTPP